MTRLLRLQCLGCMRIVPAPAGALAGTRCVACGNPRWRLARWRPAVSCRLDPEAVPWAPGPVAAAPRPRRWGLAAVTLMAVVGLVVIGGEVCYLEASRRRDAEQVRNAAAAAKVASARPLLARRRWNEAAELLQAALATPGATDFAGAGPLLTQVRQAAGGRRAGRGGDGLAEPAGDGSPAPVAGLPGRPQRNAAGRRASSKAPLNGTRPSSQGAGRTGTGRALRPRRKGEKRYPHPGHAGVSGVAAIRGPDPQGQGQPPGRSAAPGLSPQGIERHGPRRAAQGPRGVDGSTSSGEGPEQDHCGQARCPQGTFPILPRF